MFLEMRLMKFDLQFNVANKLINFHQDSDWYHWKVMGKAFLMIPFPLFYNH